MIHIEVNGQTQQADDGLTVEALLRQLSLGEKKLAVEINQEIVPRSRYAQHCLNDGDRIEIVQAIGGG